MGETGQATGIHAHHEVYTYDRSSQIVEDLINSGINHYFCEDGRLLFDSRSFYNYLDSHNIKY